MTNRFVKPASSAKPTYMFRCEYVGETSFEVEAEDESTAADEADDLMRNGCGNFVVRRLGPAASEERIGPAEWHAALALAVDGSSIARSEFDRCAIEVGRSKWWLTNGHAALLTDGPHPASSINMIRYEIGDLLEPTARSRAHGAVRMGASKWAQERYLWLVEELFGECSWHENAAERSTPNVSSLVAVCDGEVVAVVMPYRVQDAKDVEPFVAEVSA